MQNIVSLWVAMRFSSYKMVVLIFLSVFVHSCKKNKVPKISSTVVGVVSNTIVEASANVDGNGKGSVTSVGFCWSTSPNPTTSGSQKKVGSGEGNFKENITGLQPDTKYYLRAYAINKHGTAYGGEVTFQTPFYGPCDTINYTNHIKKIIDDNCISCHTNPFASGGVDLTTYLGVKASADAGRIGDRVNNTSNPMPPMGLMPQSERDKIACWLSNGKIQ